MHGSPLMLVSLCPVCLKGCGARVWLTRFSVRAWLRGRGGAPRAPGRLAAARVSMRTAAARSMRFPSRHEFAAALVGGTFTNSKTNYVK